MAEKVEITGVYMELNGRTEDIHGNHTGYFYIEFPLRDLFAAFALAAVVGLNFHDATHEANAAYAYNAADAMLATRKGNR